MSTQVTTASNQMLQQAEFAFQQNRLDQAEAQYIKMLEANFLPGVMHYRLGMIANLRGDYDKALKEHRESLRIDPTLAAKILPQGSPMQRFVCPSSFDTVENKQCAVCGGKKQEIINVVNCLPMASFHSSIDPIRVWVKCSDCGHGYPKERPSDAVLKKIYSEPPPSHLQVWNYNQIAAFSDIVHDLFEVHPNGSFLDVGTAAGVLAGVAKDFGYESVGMDIHPIYKESVERFGIKFIEGDFLTYNFGKNKYDVVAMGDVLEHMLDLKKSMKVLDGILSKNGIAWISTPNYDSAWTRAVGSNDPMWQESEHLQFFSRGSMTKLFEDHGFKIVDYRASKRYQGSVEVQIERI